MKIIIAFILAAFFAGHASAQTQDINLIEVLSQPEDNKLYQLDIELDEEANITALIFKSGDYTEIVTVEQLQAGEVVLVQVEGRDALILSCKQCDWTTASSLSMSYLNSAIANRFKEFEMDIVKDIEGQWLALSGDNEVRNLTLISNTLFGRVIGVKDVLVNNF